MPACFFLQVNSPSTGNFGRQGAQHQIGIPCWKSRYYG